MTILFLLFLFGGLMYVGVTQMGSLFDGSPPLPHQAAHAAKTEPLKGIDK